MEPPAAKQSQPDKKLPRRYKIAELERALRLGERNPASYRRLPKEVRDSVDEYHRVMNSLVKEQEATAIAFEGFPPEVKKLIRASSSHRGSEWAQVPVPALLEMFAILKKKGRPSSRETKQRVLRAAQQKSLGLSVRQLSRKLYPALSPDKAYSRTRAFLRDHRQEIEAERSNADPA